MLLADLENLSIFVDLQWCVTWVPALFVRVIVARVVAADECPARVLAGVLIRTVQSIPMKQHGRTRVEFDVNGFQALRHFAHAFGVGSRLIAHFAMVNASQPV